MSDEVTNGSGLEEAVILELLEGEPKTPDPNAPEPGSEAARLRREYREVLGLLPYGLEPGSPSPQSKARILESIELESIETPAGTERDREAAAARDAVPGSQPEGRATSVPVAIMSSEPRGGRWLLPLAASVAFAMMAVTGCWSYKFVASRPRSSFCRRSSRRRVRRLPNRLWRRECWRRFDPGWSS